MLEEDKNSSSTSREDIDKHEMSSDTYCSAAESDSDHAESREDAITRLREVLTSGLKSIPQPMQLDPIEECYGTGIIITS